jgi:hypothetical protein
MDFETLRSLQSGLPTISQARRSAVAFLALFLSRSPDTLLTAKFAGTVRRFLPPDLPAKIFA